MAITKASSSAVAPAAKGDLVAGSATNDAAVLGVGANNTVLTADSSEATGLKWATPSASGASWTLINSPSGTALTGAQTVTVSGISGYNQLAVFLGKASSASATADIGIRFNGNTTGATYGWFGFHNNITATYTPSENGIGYDGGSDGYWWIGRHATAVKEVSGGLIMSGANTSALKIVESVGSGNYATGTAAQVFLKGTVNITAAITSVSCFSSVGNLDSGTMWIYGSAV